MLPFRATTVAENGNKVLPFRATFVAVFGDFSFRNNLLLFSATFVAWCGQAMYKLQTSNVRQQTASLTLLQKCGDKISTR